MYKYLFLWLNLWTWLAQAQMAYLLLEIKQRMILFRVTTVLDPSIYMIEHSTWKDSDTCPRSEARLGLKNFRVPRACFRRRTHRIVVFWLFLQPKILCTKIEALYNHYFSNGSKAPIAKIVVAHIPFKSFAQLVNSPYSEPQYWFIFAR